MNETGRISLDGLDIDLARRIDAACRRFEADWRAGKTPMIVDYLPVVPEEARSVLRIELEALETELRQANGEPTAPEVIPPATIADAPTLAPSSPTVHEQATVAPRDQATVDLGSSGPVPPEAPSTDRVRYLGDYEVVRELARGGMGVVFLARQVSLNRPDGRTLVSAGWDRKIKLWDPDAGREIRGLPDADALVARAAFSPDGRVLATAGWDRAVTLWDPTTGKEGLVLRGHDDGILDLAFSPDGRTLASTGLDRTVRLWNVASGREIRTLRGHERPTESLCSSPDGRTLASASHFDGTVKVWDVRAGEDPRAFSAYSTSVVAVAYSPDGRVLASAARFGATKLWDPDTGREIGSLGGAGSFATSPLNKVIFSPDGRTVISSSELIDATLWDVATRRKVRTLDFGTGVWDATLSPDGRTLACACGNSENLIKFWDVATGREIGALTGHSARVAAVAYSPDGRTFAHSDKNGIIRIRDVVTKQEILTLDSRHGDLNGLAFRPDSRQLAAAAPDGTVLLWDAAPMTPELRVLREARSAVEFLAAQKLPAAEVAARIRRDSTISDAVRARALELAEHLP